MIELGRDLCSDLSVSGRREWLVVNGIGGYASGTVSGVPTRRYHGILVAALNPPLGRTLLVSKVEERAEYRGGLFRLGANRWSSGAVDPQGFLLLDRFHIEGTTPVWTYALGDALVEKRVWMEPGANTTYVRYDIRRAGAPVGLELDALVNYRDYHANTQAGGWTMAVDTVAGGVRVTAFPGARSLFLLCDRADISPSHDWYRDYFYSEEAYRGLGAGHHDRPPRPDPAHRSRKGRRRYPSYLFPLRRPGDAPQSVSRRRRIAGIQYRRRDALVLRCYPGLPRSNRRRFPRARSFSRTPGDHRPAHPWNPVRHPPRPGGRPPHRGRARGAAYLDGRQGGRPGVAPRIGKPVEINALWYNALRAMADFARRIGYSAAAYEEMADRTGEGFRRFWNDPAGYCYDVIGGPEGNDDSLRPNQLLAVSLPHSPLSEDRQRAVVDACTRDLLTPVGLRSLAPGDPRYIGHYGGNPATRDGAYHQGTAWPWLIGPFVTAHLRVYRGRATARSFLLPLLRHMDDHGLGSICEIADGDPPFTPRGCIAQAWSVAETLLALFATRSG